MKKWLAFSLEEWWLLPWKNGGEICFLEVVFDHDMFVEILFDDEALHFF